MFVASKWKCNSDVLTYQHPNPRSDYDVILQRGYCLNCFTARTRVSRIYIRFACITFDLFLLKKVTLCQTLIQSQRPFPMLPYVGCDRWRCSTTKRPSLSVSSFFETHRYFDATFHYSRWGQNISKWKYSVLHRNRNDSIDFSPRKTLLSSNSNFVFTSSFPTVKS